MTDELGEASIAPMLEKLERTAEAYKQSCSTVITMGDDILRAHQARTGGYYSSPPTELPTEQLLPRLAARVRIAGALFQDAKEQIFGLKKYQNQLQSAQLIKLVKIEIKMSKSLVSINDYKNN